MYGLITFVLEPVNKFAECKIFKIIYATTHKYNWNYDCYKNKKGEKNTGINIKRKIDWEKNHEEKN